MVPSGPKGLICDESGRRPDFADGESGTETLRIVVATLQAAGKKLPAELRDKAIRRGVA